MTLSETTETTTTPLPDGWVWTTLGEITLDVPTINPQNKPHDEIIYLDISSIDNDSNRIINPKTYKGSEAPSRARQHVMANDTLFATVRPYLKNIALVPEKYNGQVASTGFCVLRPSKLTLGRYIFYYTLTSDFITQLSTFQRGVSYPAVRDSDVKSQPVPLPPLPEQQRIVDALEAQLSRLDDGIAALRHTQRKLKRYRAAILKSACEGTLVPQEVDDEPASRLLERILAERRARWEADQCAKYADKGKTPPTGWEQAYPAPAAPDTSTLPDLPEGWVWATMEQIFRFIDYRGKTPTKVGKGIRLITAKNVRMGYIQSDPQEFIAEDAYRGWMTRGFPKYGDVLFTTEAPLGFVAQLLTHEKLLSHSV